ncbi:hypothetical protein [Alteraurantiacibacter palmitatis]|uniref:Twin-arginine translocation pathway signal n=1 Tax=Alteraurantiacibacter palmitatis TaxID=2054628 RepID=A0ABV7E8I7_9SPHN
MTAANSVHLTRRDVLAAGSALAAAATLPGQALAASAKGPALVVFDARFGLSAHLAERRAARGAATLDPRDHDLGLAWRVQLAGLLDAGEHIEGLTLWSDRLVCEILARDAGHAFVASERPQASPEGAMLYHWVIG